MDLRDEMRSYFGATGKLSEVIPGFEYRSEQLAMAEAVGRALRRGEVGLFEAGTGTGKSLAYLIPSAAHAISGKKPVVVSTYTISLQEQLLRKEIPVVEKLFPGLRVTLVKGWRNYLCRLRLEGALAGPGDLLEPGMEEELLAVARWARTTEEGTLSDLPFEPRREVWEQVAAESDSCLRSRCAYYAECPFFRDRARMAGSHLLIVNHHLLFADVALRRLLGWESEQAVLPSYAAAILDEAHHIEDVATEHFGASLTTRGVAQLFGRFHRRRQGQARGLLPALRRLLDEEGAEARPLLRSLELEVIPALGQGEEAVYQAIAEASRFFARKRAGGEGLLVPEDAGEWEESVGPSFQRASEHVLRAASLLLPYPKALERVGEENPAAATLRGQLEAARRRLASLAAALDGFRRVDPLENVYWFEANGGASPSLRLASAPVDVGPAVTEWIEVQCESLILVSATLAVGSSFAYVRERLGLSEFEPAGGRRVRETLIDSPFEYREQALLGIVDDLPDPTDAAYAERLPGALLQLVSASRGRALVLFTSVALLEQTRRALEGPLQEFGMTLFAQGTAPRTALLDAFRHTPGSVLLGTDSFWEGIDIPGEALSLVVMTRLPFDVPTDPVTRARSDRLRRDGRSSFGEYLLPRAALKVKQGFGRLIRTGTDRGVVALLDRRVLTRAYGKVFLASLPECPRLVGSVDEVCRGIEQFFSGIASSRTT